MRGQRGAVHEEAQAHHQHGGERHDGGRLGRDELRDDELRDAREGDEGKRDALGWRHPGADRGHAGHEAEGNGPDEDGRDVAATREEFASSVWRLPV